MTDRLGLRPLRQDEYEAWHAQEIEEYARDITVNGNTPAEAARAKAVMDMAEVLPDGLATRGHHVFVLELAGEPVGRLWLAEREIDGRQVIYVYDIEIDTAYRGRGLGRAAMELAETESRSRGFQRIELNVFGGNEIARRLYRSLGYVDRAVRMAKDLGPA
ncbi:MAG TPA: GNAT family N-acetyltransferase [Candidatus Limnocylindria bacterium]|nr:GNAT family N-acetyltransferase [Candidatus Limnocylindria bacterium]